MDGSGRTDPARRARARRSSRARLSAYCLVAGVIGVVLADAAALTVPPGLAQLVVWAGVIAGFSLVAGLVYPD